jgi:hypothetical protein
VSQLPANYGASFNPPVVTGGSGSTVLTVTTSTTSAPGFTATLKVTGTSGSLVHSTFLDVETAAAGDFTGTVSPEEVTVAAGGSAQYTVSLTPLGGFTGNVNLSLSGLPSTASAVFNPAVINAANPTSTLTITAPANVTDSVAYDLLIAATSGTLVHYHNVTLDITGTTGNANPLIIRRLKIVNRTFSDSIQPTTLFSPQSDGLYRINGYVVLTGTDPGASPFTGLANINVVWTDETGTQTTGVFACNSYNQNPSLSITAAPLGQYCGLTFPVYAVASAPVTFSVTVPNSLPATSQSRFSLYITVEKL